MASINDSDLILVTGASGYIATHIVKQLLEKGYRVRGTVRSLKDQKKVEPLRKLAPNPKHELELVEADLTNEKGWSEAVKDCTYVLHTASPFPNEVPKDENELIKPAVNGTLFVLRACVQEGSKVKRVVLTSSVVAIFGDFYERGKIYSEKDWPNLNGLSPYSKSKTFAEKAAWDFIKEREKNNQPCFELSVINPGYVLGPLIHDAPCTSMEVIKRLMLRDVPLVPDVSFPVCDVRDVALAHIKAMTIPEAKNNRHMISTLNETFTFQQIALVLKAEFDPKNYHVPSKLAPNCMIKFLSIFDKTLKLITPMLGIKVGLDNTRFTKVLGINPIDINKTIIEMGYSLIEKKYVPKKF